MKSDNSTETFPRVGYGYDVHRLVSGRPLVLGGVTIPHPRGLEGHSDADVLLHAICDALLGAAALGDIGQHFPNSDERLRGIASITLLERVAHLVADRGLTVSNIDATVIIERPILAPHVPAMRSAIAVALGIPERQVSVKATTGERLGFAGREEGAAAHAVALLVPRRAG